mmetsp:Transcript_13117/g.28706  ORF Transcript_13117/g.28706 Transcript_13117/m.28706 type:complete len:322 (+) Transcript_13117:797-1762(+)
MDVRKLERPALREVVRRGDGLEHLLHEVDGLEGLLLLELADGIFPLRLFEVLRDLRADALLVKLELVAGQLVDVPPPALQEADKHGEQHRLLRDLLEGRKSSLEGDIVDGEGVLNELAMFARPCFITSPHGQAVSRKVLEEGVVAELFLCDVVLFLGAERLEVHNDEVSCVEPLADTLRPRSENERDAHRQELLGNKVLHSLLHVRGLVDAVHEDDECAKLQGLEEHLPRIGREVVVLLDEKSHQVSVEVAGVAPSALLPQHARELLDWEQERDKWHGLGGVFLLLGDQCLREEVNQLLHGPRLPCAWASPHENRLRAPGA